LKPASPPASADEAPVAADRVDSLQAEFALFDRGGAMVRLQALAAQGFDETRLVMLSSWSLVDVRRALGGLG
jgi:hypothetical protein